MAKVTSKLQVTLPKAIADQYGIVPGDEIEFQAAGDFIRIVPPRARARTARLTLEERLRLFDAATERLRRLQSSIPVAEPGAGRGWKREDLYTRGETR
jgi:AbrB family looped-hinge helix DNA binding protein